MENLSEPVEKIATPLAIPVPSYLRDHHVGSRVVLPAVEALRIAAHSRPETRDTDLRRQERAVFRHPLLIDCDAAEIRVVLEQERYAGGRRFSRLTTLLSGRRMSYTRRVEHLSVWFAAADHEAGRGSLSGAGPPSEPGRVRRAPFGSGEDFGPGIDSPSEADDPTPIKGTMFRVSADRLYDELVPFGPAYRNVRGDVLLTEAGVSATVSGGDFPEAADWLGSPFPLDAAMHAACAWGQRYRNRVVFPVGFERREILFPTRAGEIYPCRIMPLPEEGSLLRFDIRIFGPDRQPVETVRGLAMKEIFGGKLVPPAWIGEGIR